MVVESGEGATTNDRGDEDGEEGSERYEEETAGGGVVAGDREADRGRHVSDRGDRRHEEEDASKVTSFTGTTLFRNASNSDAQPASCAVVTDLPFRPSILSKISGHCAFVLRKNFLKLL